MTGTGTCGEVRLELGIYVLGAIGVGGRSAVDAHLACCADCRDELAELAGLPGLLSRVSADDADSLLLYRDDGGCGRHELSADLSPGTLPGCAARLRRHRMRYQAVPCRTRRAIMPKQGGDSAR
jgi:hypothetical protein